MTGPPAPPDRPGTSVGAGRRLVAAVAVVCATLGSAGALIAWSTYRDEGSAAVESVRLHTRAVAANVYGSRIAVVRHLEAIADGPEFAAGDPAGIRARLDTGRSDQLGLTGGLAWVDGTGTVRAATRGAIGVPADGAWWRPVADGASWTTSAVLTAPAFDGEVMVFAVPTRAADGTVNGVLAAGWSIPWLRDVAARQAATIGPEFYGPNTDLLVVDRAGQLFVGPGVDRARDVRAEPVHRRLVGGGQGFVSGARAEPAGLSGRPDQVVGWTRVGDFGEYVVLERPTADAWAAPRRKLAGWLVGILLVAVLALVGAGVAGRRIDRLTAERDRLHQADHDAVADLQRWLLTDDLPAGAVGRYLPAPSVLNAGGDWYDVIPLSGGRHALLVGDVVGHGVKAALAMGQLRIAARALAGRVDGPAALLAELDSHVTALPDVVFCTAACVVTDPTTATLRYVSAGHPPPLLRAPDGTVTALPTTSRPLGVAGRPRTEQAVAAPGGSMVVLYTDGLVEVPDEMIDVGIARLADAVAADDAGADDWAGRLISGVRQGRPAGDDIALLCFPLPTGATPAAPRTGSPVVGSVGG